MGHLLLSKCPSQVAKLNLDGLEGRIRRQGELQLEVVVLEFIMQDSCSDKSPPPPLDVCLNNLDILEKCQITFKHMHVFLRQTKQGFSKTQLCARDPNGQV